MKLKPTAAPAPPATDGTAVPTPDAAVQNVFASTIEQANAPVQVKVGETCDKPKVRGFRIMKRGEMTKTTAIPQGYYPMTAQVELQ